MAKHADTLRIPFARLLRRPRFWVIAVPVLLLATVIIVPNLIPAGMIVVFRQERRNQRKIVKAMQRYHKHYGHYPKWEAPAVWPDGKTSTSLYLAKEFPSPRMAENYPTFSTYRGEADIAALTTPLAFIKELPNDRLSDWRPFPLRYYCTDNDAALDDLGEKRPSVWIVWNCGPRNFYFIDLPLLRRLARQQPHQLTPQGLAPYTYDPTNGSEQSHFIHNGDYWMMGEAGLPLAESPIP